MLKSFGRSINVVRSVCINTSSLRGIVTTSKNTPSRFAAAGSSSCASSPLRSITAVTRNNSTHAGVHILPRIAQPISNNPRERRLPFSSFDARAFQTRAHILGDTPRRYMTTTTTSAAPHSQMTASQDGNRLRFDLDAQQITETANKIIADAKAIQDKVAALPEEERSFQSVVLPLAFAEADFDTLASNVTFPSYVSPNKEIRDAATEANKKIQDFGIESNMREDVYKALKTVKEKEYNQLDKHQKRLLDRMIRDFERTGLGLPEEKRGKAKELKKKIANLCIEFNKNIAEDKTKVLFTREELEGLPEDFLEGLEKDAETGKYIVTLKYPELLPVMRYAKNPETRKRMEWANSTQCQGTNVKLLEEVVKLRYELAQLLGFKDHASYILDIRMAKTPERVMEFLNSLKERTGDAAKRDLDVLLELKKKECEELNIPFDGKINAWDFNYYYRLLKETQYQVNEEEIKDYFPLSAVLDGTFAIFQDVLRLKFEEVKNPAVWHEDVRQFNVFDADHGHFIGQFYLDIFPREGKYTHAAAFPLQGGFERPDGTRQHAVSAMVCNFTKPTATKPSLLKHSEVVTFWHEFGHLMHGVTTRSKYGRFSGTAVERDFVECPSQLMENWCWESEGLARQSQHYQTGAALPQSVIDKMIAAKNVLSGLLTRRQIFFGLFDMTIHTATGRVDTESLWEKLRNEVTLVEHTKGTNPAASFGHLMGGYDAGYYGYLYSEVFSDDVFSRFKKEGIFNGAVGRHYRDTILERGGMEDGADMIRNFLGREPNEEAFLISKGILPTKQQ